MTARCLMGVLLACVIGTLLPAAAAEAADDYREIQGGNNQGLRVRPDNDSDYVTRGLRNGDRVRVLGCEKHNGNDWCRVVYSNVIGWIGAKRLRPVSGGEQPQGEEWVVKDAGGGLPLRANPDKDARVVVQGLRNGDRVRVLGCEKHQDHRWCRVQFEGYTGWIGQARLQQP